MDKKEILGNDKSSHINAVHEWNPVDESGRHKSSQEIENDIEETRHSMDMILDALSGRVSPNTVYRRAVRYFQNSTNRDNVRKSLSDVSESISGSFQRNPLPVMMATAGAAWMLWETQHNGRSHDGKTDEQMQQLKGKAEGQFNTAQGKAGEATETTRAKAGETVETARARADELSGKAGEAVSAARKKAGAVFDRTRQRSEEYRERGAEMKGTGFRRADTAVHNNSLLFGIGAALAGIIAGLMIPESKTEQSYAGERAGGLIEKAEEKGKEISTQATSAASAKAEEKGITAEQMTQKVKETMGESGKATRNKAKEEADVLGRPVRPGGAGNVSGITMKKNEEKSPSSKEDASGQI